MAVTFTASNHYKAQRQKGAIRLKAQLHNVSLVFANTPGKITLPSSALTAGFEVGGTIYTNSANAANKGPFIVKAISGVGDVDVTVMTTAGADPTLTIGTENNLTVGTYLVKVLLMRSGFVFNKDDHATLTNLKATTGAINLTFVAATKKMTRAAGSFLTDGFVVGNKFTTDAVSNPGPFTISAATALEITVNEVVVNEGPVLKTATANDELATGFGYTQNTKLSGVMTITEDDALDVGDADFPTVTWTAAGGSIGPASGALLYDDSTSDDTIIGHFDFGGDQTATDATTFNLAAGKLRTS